MYNEFKTYYINKAAIMDKDEKLIWRAFHRAEKRLFDYLVDNCDCLFSVEGDEPAYLEYANRHGVTLEKPPRFVHWIGQLRTSEIDYWHMAEQVQGVVSGNAK